MISDRQLLFLLLEREMNTIIMESVFTLIQQIIYLHAFISVYVWNVNTFPASGGKQMLPVKLDLIPGR